MASGTITGSWHSTGNQYRLIIRWTSTPDEANNRSSVTVKTYLDCDWAINYTATKDGYTICNGSRRDWSSSTDRSGTGEWLIKTETYTVNHNTDGKKSITISSRFYIEVSTSRGFVSYVTASGTATLDNIDVCDVYYGTGGSYKRGKAVYYGTGGSWKKCAMYYGSGGSWRKVSN